jgi:DNA invertase Pin-like site-specific DNA recombinase
MKVGYVRVSSIGQNIDRQTDLMSDLGVEKVYVDRVSGKNTNRPKLNEMMAFLREGDILAVESISRLARNTKDLLDLTEQLEDKGVKFISKKENIDTSTPTGRFTLTIFGAIAELERGYIRERQAEGIAAAKCRGKSLGRPRLNFPDEWENAYQSWRSGKITAVEAYSYLGVKKTMFYQLVKRYEADSWRIAETI